MALSPSAEACSPRVRDCVRLGATGPRKPTPATGPPSRNATRKWCRSVDDYCASELLAIMDRLGWDHGGLSAAADRTQLQAEAHALLGSMLRCAARIAFLLSVDDVEDDDGCNSDDDLLTAEERTAFDQIVALDELL